MKSKNKIYFYTHLASYLTILTGIIYYLFIHFFKVETDYGIRPHFLQQWFQASHILISPMLVFMVGILFIPHILKNLHGRYKKRSGITLIVIFFIMTFSGYWIQVSKSDLTIDLSTWLHLATSLIWIIVYLLHHFYKYK